MIIGAHFRQMIWIMFGSMLGFVFVVMVGMGLGFGWPPRRKLSPNVWIWYLLNVSRYFQTVYGKSGRKIPRLPVNRAWESHEHDVITFKTCGWYLVEEQVSMYNASRNPSEVLLNMMVSMCSSSEALSSITCCVADPGCILVS